MLNIPVESMSQLHDVKNQMKLSNCVAPWYELNVGYDRRVACCCYYSGLTDRWNNQVPADLDAYWNSDNMRTVRRTVSYGDLTSNHGCHNCWLFRFRDDPSPYCPEFFDPPNALSAEQRINWKKAIDNVANKKQNIDSFPIRYYINFGLACNLSCIMCSQTPQRRVNKDQVSADSVLQLAPYLKKAYRISVIGGEPFVLSEALTFMKCIANDSSFSSVWLDIFTNGTLLHKYLGYLQPKQRVHLVVSLDSMQDTYEYIRRGARWRQVEENILLFKETARKKNLNWNISTANLIMKSSLKTLVDFIEWSIHNEIPPNFANFICVEGCEATFRSENIFEYPRLLEEIPNWHRIFEEAIERLESVGWKTSASILRNMKAELSSKLCA